MSAISWASWSQDKGRGAIIFAFYVVYAKTIRNVCAQWLQENVPSDVAVYPHYRVRLESTVKLIFDMDIILKSKSTGKVLAVLDTKYKRDP